jgi:uncharacterized delta-60 repeat protein
MKNYYCTILFLIFSSFYAQNQGDVLQNFGSYEGFNNNVLTTAVQNDGKIIVGGEFISFKGVTQNRIIRFNIDGTKDLTFNSGSGFDNSVNSIIIQNDGKIIVGGSFTNYNGQAENRIIRLNSDGTKDSSFITGVGFNNNVKTIKIQNDGKIYLGGDFTSYNGIAENRIVKLNSNGTKDNSFISGNGFNSSVNCFSIQNDGKIIVAGNFISYNGISKNRLVRLNTNGDIDNSFTIGNGFNSSIYSIALQSDGKIILGGEFVLFNGTSQNSIVRLNSDGSIDNTFLIGTGFSGAVYSIKIQTDNKIVVGGSFISYKGITENRIIRLNNDASEDINFISGSGFDSTIFNIELDNNNKIIVGGAFTTYGGIFQQYFVRLNSDGNKDNNFNYGFGFVESVVGGEQLDGKIIAIGYFTSYKGVKENRIIRFNIDGSKDNTFITGTGFNGYVNNIKIQNDGKIIVSGNFTSYNGVNAGRIVRLNTDGTIDSSFLSGTGFSGLVMSINLQNDGKIIVKTSNTNSYNGVGFSNNLIRLNQDGTKDTSFSAGAFGGGIGTVSDIDIQNDGKIILVGFFETYTYSSFTSTRPGIIRLNSNGTNDTTFNIGSGFGSNYSLRQVKIQSDGKIILAGLFNSYNGEIVSSIIRLNNNGTRDNTFNSTITQGSSIFNLDIQSDGKILICGQFTLPYNRLARLNQNGTVDTNFNIGSGFDNSVYSAIELINGSILASGNFKSYNGSFESSYLINLYGNSSLTIEDFNNTDDLIIFPNPTKDLININSLNNQSFSSVKVFDLSGKMLIESSDNKISVSNLVSGLYLLKITTETGEITKKFIKE